MRTALAGVVLLSIGALVHAQPAKEPDPRYGVTARVRLYPQATPKGTLRTALERVDAGDYSYFVAHLLDPKFVDEVVTDRASALEAATERELAQLRDFQRANPNTVVEENRVPLDPKEFRAAVTAKARNLGFKQLLKDIEAKLKEDPQAQKDMRKLLRDGAFAEADGTATASHADVKGRTLYFKKIGERWFIENKQAEEPKKEP
ncbi:hypothetical protein J8F10_08210 [Gemmata sp. G18]|uniref:Uncharacterized protein n=1 Tax=Gemmata palustris TaxID=2822762 RepID=A0ABS5BNK8_9BACT|nr:hypothetical protein [Gemmata palustris]MBP3955262.1 hypothetical protein [Gemmata palustris]